MEYRSPGVSVQATQLTQKYHTNIFKMFPKELENVYLNVYYDLKCPVSEKVRKRFNNVLSMMLYK